MNNAEISNININNNGEVRSNEYHYIGVVFENKSGYGKPFNSKVYEYKTTRPLKEGQVIKINSMKIFQKMNYNLKN